MKRQKKSCRNKQNRCYVGRQLRYVSFHLFFCGAAEDNFPSVPVFLHLKESLKVKERLTYLILPALLCSGCTAHVASLWREDRCARARAATHTHGLTSNLGLEDVSVNVIHSVEDRCWGHLHLMSWNLTGQQWWG